MSSSQCLRRLGASSAARRASTLRSGTVVSRSLSRPYAGVRALSTSYSFLKPSASPPQREPLYITQSRQFSLSSRYNEEQTVKTPEMAESITEGTLKGWSKAVGDYVEEGEEIGSIETDKIDVAISAPAAGTIKEFLVNEEDTVEVGQDILILTLGGEAPKKEDSGKQEQPKQEEKPKQEEPKQESKPNQEETKPSQPAPEPPKQEKQTGQPKQEKTSPSKQDSKPPPPPKQEQSTAPYGNREERRVKMNRMRLRIAERLKQSQNTAASLTTFNEVDMSNLMNMRKEYKDEILKKTGVKFGFMGAFAMASVLGMKTVPTVNASIEGPGGGDTIVYRDYVDISVAVATEKGLVTPVVRNAESLDIIGIEKEISALGKKARDNKLTIEDMAGGTFTISNGGVFGSLMGTPIINLPQTAVLGLHAIKDKPVVVDGKIEIRPMMYLALTYDHRLLDGREAVTFLVKIKEYIEDPRKMLLSVY